MTRKHVAETIHKCPSCGHESYYSNVRCCCTPTLPAMEHLQLAKEESVAEGNFELALAIRDLMRKHQ